MAPVTTPGTLVVAPDATTSSLGIAAPIDSSVPSSTDLAVSVTSLPDNGSVTLGDGTTAVTVGELLTVAQLTSLDFTPAPDTSNTNSTFSYSVTDPDFVTEGGTESVLVTCFTAGTRILTPRGGVAVERLREGGVVVTVTGKRARIQWIGRRNVDCQRHVNRERVLPIRIASHAFGQDRPKRPLLLSPDHSVFVEGVLIPIKFLANGSTIRQIEVNTVSYFHIELERHEVVLAEGLPVETYLETGGRNAFANASGAMQLHPDFAPDEGRVAMIWRSFGYAPLIGSNGEFERVTRMLEIQAAMLRRQHGARDKSAGFRNGRNKRASKFALG